LASPAPAERQMVRLAEVALMSQTLRQLHVVTLVASDGGKTSQAAQGRAMILWESGDKTANITYEDRTREPQAIII
jgi:hypothetical protein